MRFQLPSASVTSTSLTCPPETQTRSRTAPEPLASTIRPERVTFEPVWFVCATGPD